MVSESKKEEIVGLINSGVRDSKLISEMTGVPVMDVTDIIISQPVNFKSFDYSGKSGVQSVQPPENIVHDERGEDNDNDDDISETGDVPSDYDDLDTELAAAEAEAFGAVNADNDDNDETNVDTNQDSDEEYHDDEQGYSKEDVAQTSESDKTNSVISVPLGSHIPDKLKTVAKVEINNCKDEIKRLNGLKEDKLRELQRIESKISAIEADMDTWNKIFNI